MRRTIATLLLASACCRLPGSSVPPPGDPQGDALAELAQRIDPGDWHPTLDAGMPPWLADELRVADRPDVGAIAKRLAAQPGWRLPGRSNDTEPVVLELLRAAASLERALDQLEGDAALDAKFVLIEVYGRLDAPILDDGRSEASLQFRVLLFGKATGAVAARFDDVWPVIQASVTGAGPLQRHLLATVLRSAGRHDPRLPAAMIATAEHLTAGPPTRDDVELANAAIELRGDAASADQLLDVAMVCARALNEDCAADMLERAHTRAAGDDASSQRDLDEVAGYVAKVRRIHELGGASGLEADLENARLLEDLARNDDAFGAYSALAQRHPTDARVVIGKERIALQRSFDFVAAAERLDAIPRPLEHVEAEYYEYAIGVRAAAASITASPDGSPTLEEIRERLFALVPQLTVDAQALARLGSDSGAVLQYVLEVGMAAKELAKRDRDAAWALCGRVLAHMMELHERFPESVPVHRVLIGSAVFASDRELAARALALPVPAAGGALLAYEQLQARYAASYVWGEAPPPEEQPPAQAMARALGRMHADAEAIAARASTDPARWTAVLRRYAAPVAAGEQVDVRHGNQLAVAMAQSGDLQGARTALEQTVAAARTTSSTEDGEVPLLNLVALGGRPRSELELLAGAAEDDTVRAAALALLVRDSQGTERRRWRARLAREKDVRCEDIARGFAMARSVTFQLGYSTTARLKMHMGVEVEPWLLVDAAIAALRRQLCSAAPKAGAPRT